MYVQTTPSLNEALSAVDPTAYRGIKAINARLPRTGNGWVTKKPNNHRYGIPETIEAIKAIAQAWVDCHGDNPPIRIGDISRRHGGSPYWTDKKTGKIKHHKSHVFGLDVDIHLIRKSKPQPGDIPTAVRVDRKDYSKTLTQDLVNLIWHNGVLPVKAIYLADSDIKGVTVDKVHRNHMHVRFCAPAYFRKTADKRYRYCSGKIPSLPALTCNKSDDPADGPRPHPGGLPPQIFPVPIPGGFYLIRRQDTLFGITGKAFGVKPGKTRLRLAQMINNSRYNRRFWRPASNQSRKWFPNGMISFSPRFASPERQLATQGFAPLGRQYAMIWIPSQPGVEPLLNNWNTARLKRPRRYPTRVS